MTSEKNNEKQKDDFQMLNGGFQAKKRGYQPKKGSNKNLKPVKVKLIKKSDKN